MKNEQFTEDQVKAEEPEHSNDNNQADNPEKEVTTEKVKDTTTPGNGEVTPDMPVTYIDIKSIITGYHPRKDLGDMEGFLASIKRDGFLSPILVRQEGDKFVPIDGIRRIKAARELGLSRILAIIKRDVGASEAAHLSYVKNSERTDFNPIEIALHLKAMQEEFDYSLRDLELMGYGSPTNILKKMKVLDLPEWVQRQMQKRKLTVAHGSALTKLRSKKEQMKMANRIIDHDLTAKRAEIQIGRYLAKGRGGKKRVKVQIPATEIPGVYIKDSRDMSELPDRSSHLIVTSPPYNVGMEYEKGVPFKEHLEMVKDVLKECNRVLVSGGIMAVNVGDNHIFRGPTGKNDQVQTQLMGHIYQSYLRRRGIFLTDTIIWKKSMPWSRRQHIFYSEDTVHTSYRILDNFELVYIFRKTGEREVPPEDIVLKSRLNMEQWKAWTPGVWEIASVKDQTEHPSIYPDELRYRLIKMFSYEGDTVLDPWLGSGTTVKVANELNRKGVGYEKEPQYKPVIMKKLGVESKKPMAEFFTNTMKENVEKTQANLGNSAAENVETTVQQDRTDAATQEAVAMEADGELKSSEPT